MHQRKFCHQCCHLSGPMRSGGWIKCRDAEVLCDGRVYMRGLWSSRENLSLIPGSGRSCPTCRQRSVHTVKACSGVSASHIAARHNSICITVISAAVLTYNEPLSARPYHSELACCRSSWRYCPWSRPPYGAALDWWNTKGWLYHLFTGVTVFHGKGASSESCLMRLVNWKLHCRVWVWPERLSSASSELAFTPWWTDHPPSPSRASTRSWNATRAGRWLMVTHVHPIFFTRSQKRSSISTCSFRVLKWCNQMAEHNWDRYFLPSISLQFISLPHSPYPTSYQYQHDIGKAK